MATPLRCPAAVPALAELLLASTAMHMHRLAPVSSKHAPRAYQAQVFRRFVDHTVSKHLR